MSLTAQFYAGDADKLWTNPVDGGSHTGTPINNGLVGVWQDEATPTTRNFIFDGSTNTASQPHWKSPSSMQLPSLDFDGTDSMLLFNNSRGSQQSISSLFGASAKTIIMAIIISAGGTNNANIYDNTGIFSDSSAYFGIHLKTVTSTHTLYAYNWDGNADSVGVQVSLNTPYIIMLRHNGTTLNLSVLSTAGGASRSDGSVASGPTSNVTGFGKLATNYQTSLFTGQIGEIYFDNTDLGNTNSVLTDFVSRWLPGGGGGGSTAQTPASFFTNYGSFPLRSINQRII